MPPTPSDAPLTEASRRVLARVADLLRHRETCTVTLELHDGGFRSVREDRRIDPKTLPAPDASRPDGY